MSKHGGRTGCIEIRKRKVNDWTTLKNNDLMYDSRFLPINWAPQQ